MVVRSSVVFNIALASISWLMPLRGIGEESSITSALHPWGRFDPGDWKTVRVITETLNEQGQVVSTTTTDTKTTLVDRDHDGVTLEIQACMEVAGRALYARLAACEAGLLRRIALSQPQGSTAYR